MKFLGIFGEKVYKKYVFRKSRKTRTWTSQL